MPTFKIIIFGLLVILFSLSVYAFSKQNPPMTGVADMVIPAFLILTSIVLGIIIIIISVKAPKLYLHVCLVLLIPLGLYMLFSVLSGIQNKARNKQSLIIYNEQRDILDKAQEELLNNNIVEADRLLKSVNSRSNESIQSATAEAYLAFYLSDPKYADDYISLLEGSIRNAYTLNRFLRKHPLTTEKECLKIFDLLDKTGDHNNNAMLQNDVEKNLSFPVLVKKKYYQAAVRSIDYSWSTHGYDEVALKIDQEGYRHEALQKLKDIQTKKENNKKE